MTTTAISETTVITILSTSGRPTLITGSSIQLPIQIQSAIATIPVNVTSGSINVGSITLVVDVATVSDILAGTINSVQQVGTVSVLSSITATVSVQVIAGTVDVTILGTPPVQIAGGTVNTVQQVGTVSVLSSITATVSVQVIAGTVDVTILGTPPVQIAGGTVNTVQQVGTVSVLSSITATVSVQVIAGTVDVTVLGTPTVQVVGGTVVPQPGTVSYQYIQVTGLATVKATAGTFYGAMVAGESGLTATAATVVVMNNLSTIAVLVTPAGDTRELTVPQGGVGFATLVVNVSAGDATVFYS